MIGALLAAALAAAPAAPPVLAPYIHGEHFEAGDYRWMRGALPDASTTDRQAWQAITAYRRDCGAASRAVVNAELSALGIADPQTTSQGHSDPVCTELFYATPDLSVFRNAADLDAAVAAAQPIAATVLWSTKLAQAAADPEEHTLRAALRAIVMTDQLLRTALAWNEGEHRGAPALSPGALAIARATLWSAIHNRDATNTAWLKATVARSGWPTIGAVGAEASGMAWLLAQHADDDPAFQLQMLRLMTPLVPKRQVSAQNYALLYDRVMLAVGDKQRYGTQMICAHGRWTPRPLEAPDGVDARRRSVDLGTEAEYAEQMARVAGRCPAEP